MHSVCDTAGGRGYSGSPCVLLQGVLVHGMSGFVAFLGTMSSLLSPGLKTLIGIKDCKEPWWQLRGPHLCSSAITCAPSH